MLDSWESELWDSTGLLDKYTEYEETKIFWLYNTKVIKSYMLLEFAFSKIFAKKYPGRK